MNYPNTIKAAILSLGLFAIGCSQNEGAQQAATHTTTTRPAVTTTQTRTDTMVAHSDQQMVQMLLQHHHIGVDLAEQARKQAQSGEIKEMAGRIIQENGQEIQRLESLRGQVASSDTGAGMSASQSDTEDNGDTAAMGSEIRTNNSDTAAMGSSQTENSSGSSDATASNYPQNGNSADSIVGDRGVSQSGSGAGNSGTETTDSNARSGSGSDQYTSQSGARDSLSAGTQSAGGAHSGMNNSGAASTGITSGSNQSGANDSSGSASSGSGMNQSGMASSGSGVNNASGNALASADLGPTTVAAGDGPFDERWLNTMIEHNRALIQLVEQHQANLQNPELRTLVTDLTRERQEQIAQLEQSRPTVGQDTEE
jgi:uncharacterized protein (DUF305 family)